MKARRAVTRVARHAWRAAWRRHGARARPTVRGYRARRRSRGAVGAGPTALTVGPGAAPPHARRGVGRPSGGGARVARPRAGRAPPRPARPARRAWRARRRRIRAVGPIATAR